MTDDERRDATRRLIARYRRREIPLWLSVVVAVALLAVGVPAMAASTDGPSTPLALAIIFSGAWLLGVGWAAPMFTVSLRRLRRDLARMRATAGPEAPAPPGVLEVAWRPEGHGLLLWNGVEAAALAGPGLAGIIWPNEEPPKGPGWSRQLRGSATPYQWMLLDGREYVVLVGRWQLIDPHGRAWPLPRPGTGEHGDVVRVALPGELGPLGAVAVFVLATQLHAYAEQARALR